jgi:hypothetical protein
VTAIAQWANSPSKHVAGSIPAVTPRYCSNKIKYAHRRPKKDLSVVQVNVRVRVHVHVLVIVRVPVRLCPYQENLLVFATQTAPLLAHINWRCQVLQRFLLFAENFNNSHLTGGKMFLTKFKIVSRKKMPSTPSPNEYVSFTPIFNPS